MKEFPFAVEGTWGSAFVKELKPEEGDYVITKRRGSAFYNTDLQLLLRSIGVHMLIITGIATDACVDATVHDATDNRDFNVIVITNCTATNEKKLQDFWIENVYPRSTVTMTTIELLETLRMFKI